jgi:hypothetical protein
VLTRSQREPQGCRENEHIHQRIGAGDEAIEQRAGIIEHLRVDQEDPGDQPHARDENGGVDRRRAIPPVASAAQQQQYPGAEDRRSAQVQGIGQRWERRLDPAQILVVRPDQVARDGESVAEREEVPGQAVGRAVQPDTDQNGKHRR